MESRYRFQGAVLQVPGFSDGNWVKRRTFVVHHRWGLPAAPGIQVGGPSTWISAGVNSQCTVLQVPGFNDGKWIAVGDEEGFVSIIDGASRLPQAFRPGDPEAPRPQAQWLAHHNAIFDLAWCQVAIINPAVQPYPTGLSLIASCLHLSDSLCTVRGPCLVLSVSLNLQLSPLCVQPPSIACYILPSKRLAML